LNIHIRLMPKSIKVHGREDHVIMINSSNKIYKAFLITNFF